MTPPWVANSDGTSRGGVLFLALACVRLTCGCQRQGSRGQGGSIGSGRRLTLDLDRVSPTASTQTYSAMMLPFWSSFMYLLTCGTAGQHPVRELSGLHLFGVRTVSVLEERTSRVACTGSVLAELLHAGSPALDWVVGELLVGVGTHHDCGCFRARAQQTSKKRVKGGIEDGGERGEMRLRESKPGIKGAAIRGVWRRVYRRVEGEAWGGEGFMPPAATSPYRGEPSGQPTQRVLAARYR